MMGEYTPTTDKIATHSMNAYAPSMDEIRAGWVMYSTWKRVPTCGRVQAEAEFDAALASELAKAELRGFNKGYAQADREWRQSGNGRGLV